MGWEDALLWPGGESGAERSVEGREGSAESGDQMTGVGQCQLQSVGGLLPGAGCCHQLPHDTKGGVHRCQKGLRAPHHSQGHSPAPCTGSSGSPSVVPPRDVTHCFGF